jgi:hypothetical protein
VELAVRIEDGSLVAGPGNLDLLLQAMPVG